MSRREIPQITTAPEFLFFFRLRDPARAPPTTRATLLLLNALTWLTAFFADTNQYLRGANHSAAKATDKALRLTCLDKR
jgi:hypothetical protein